MKVSLSIRGLIHSAMGRGKRLKILCALQITLLCVAALAHDPVMRDPNASATDSIPLSANYTITFILTAEGTKQQADLITSQRAVSFDFVDDPEHSLRFKGQLKPETGDQVTLAYSAMLLTLITTATNAKQASTTSGEGAVILQFNKPMTILKSARQQLAISIRPTEPAASPSASVASSPP